MFSGSSIGVLLLLVKVSGIRIVILKFMDWEKHCTISKQKVFGYTS